jgi:hypothetical protein
LSTKKSFVAQPASEQKISDNSVAHRRKNCFALRVREISREKINRIYRIENRERYIRAKQAGSDLRSTYSREPCVIWEAGV